MDHEEQYTYDSNLDYLTGASYNGGSTWTNLSYDAAGNRNDATVCDNLNRATTMRVATFDNEQRLDFEFFLGRVLSSSYVPLPGTAGHEEIVAAITDLFTAEAVGGKICFAYDTHVYYGRLMPDA